MPGFVMSKEGIPMNYTHMPTARLAWQAAYKLVDPLIDAMLDQLCRTWQTHLRLLAHNPRYAAAVASAAAGLTGQDSPLDLIAAIAAALLAIHTAARRVIAHL
jgi:hypothetical protein